MHQRYMTGLCQTLSLHWCSEASTHPQSAQGWQGSSGRLPLAREQRCKRAGDKAGDQVSPGWHSHPPEAEQPPSRSAHPPVSWRYPHNGSASTQNLFEGHSAAGACKAPLHHCLRMCVEDGLCAVAGESRSSPLPSARQEKGDKAEGDQQTGADTPLQRGGETKHAGWFQNDTYAAVRPSEVHICRTSATHMGSQPMSQTCTSSKQQSRQLPACALTGYGSAASIIAQQLIVSWNFVLEVWPMCGSCKTGLCRKPQQLCLAGSGPASRCPWRARAATPGACPPARPAAACPGRPSAPRRPSPPSRRPGAPSPAQGQLSAG